MMMNFENFRYYFANFLKVPVQQTSSKAMLYKGYFKIKAKRKISWWWILKIFAIISLIFWKFRNNKQVAKPCSIRAISKL